MKIETLYKYFNNCATEEERKEVVAWVQASPENLKEFCRERNIYNALLLSTDSIRHTQYDFRRHYRIQLLRIASVVILLLAVAFGSFCFTMGDRIVPIYSLSVPAVSLLAREILLRGPLSNSPAATVRVPPLMRSTLPTGL